MESVRFRFLSHAEFFALSQDEKASYLVTAVKELVKMTDLLAKPERPELTIPAARPSAKPRSSN